MIMANKFTEIAKHVMGGSPVMQGRNKMTTEQVIEAYPSGVTIIEFDLIQKADGDTYPVFAFKEDEGSFFNGGTMASKVVNEWIDEYDGNIDRCNADLKAAGGAKFRLGKAKTKTGKSITTFDPVE